MLIYKIYILLLLYQFWNLFQAKINLYKKNIAKFLKTIIKILPNLENLGKNAIKKPKKYK